jgi:hydroxyacylglutathione hydrolase
MAITVVPQLFDNYAYLVSDDASGASAVIDCAEADKVLAEVARLGVKLKTALTTHWHPDHSGGNTDLVRAVPGLRVYGARAESGRVPALTDEVADGDRIQVGALEATVIGVPAHTSGHVAYYFRTLTSVFTGDTLFVGGCGRVFEGKAATMFQSLAKLAALPDDTRVWCGHEYTEKNLRFALTLEPGNRALEEKYKWARRVTAEGGWTVPSTVGEEKATNPFLRLQSPEVRANLKAAEPSLGDDPVVLFARARELKDRF